MQIEASHNCAQEHLPAPCPYPTRGAGPRPNAEPLNPVITSYSIHYTKLYDARGRSFNVTDDRNLRRAAILGAGIAEKFFGKPGSYGAEDPLGKRVSIGNFGEVEVVGVLEREPPSLFQAIQSYDSTNNGTVFVPFSAVGRFGGNRETYQLYVEASSENSVERAQEAILTLLSRNHGQWDGTPKYSVETSYNFV